MKLFSELGLSAELLKAIDKLGFEQAAPIQAEAIPVLMQGRDVVGQSQTGSTHADSLGVTPLECFCVPKRSRRYSRPGGGVNAVTCGPVGKSVLSTRQFPPSRRVHLPEWQRSGAENARDCLVGDDSHHRRRPRFLSRWQDWPQPLHNNSHWDCIWLDAGTIRIHGGRSPHARRLQFGALVSCDGLAWRLPKR